MIEIDCTEQDKEGIKRNAVNDANELEALKKELLNVFDISL